MRRLLLIVLAVVLGIALVVVPLFVVQRSQCSRGGEAQDDWTLAIPFEDRPRPGCREPESGAELLLEFVRGE